MSITLENLGLGQKCLELFRQGELRVCVVQGIPADDNVRDCLDRVCEILGGPLYFTYDWMRTWAEEYGRGLCILFFLILEGSTVAGFMPFYLQDLGAGPVRLRAARLLGANIPPKCFDPPCSRAAAQVACESIVAHLLTNRKCDVVSFGPISKAWSSWQEWSAAAEHGNGRLWRMRKVISNVRTLFALPSTYEEYLRSLDSSERKRRLKRLRHLERHFEIRVDVVRDRAAVVEEFERFVAMHSDQWGRRGRGGHFLAWPRGLEFHRKLVRRQAALGRVRFYRMLANGEVVARRYTFGFGPVLYSELAARQVGRPWDQMGIGICSLMYFIRQAIDDGFKMIDSGLGHYEHKTSVGGEEVEVACWRFFPRAGLRRLGGQAGYVLCRVGLEVYRKLWYRRIVPLLPQGVSRAQNRSILSYDV